MKKISLFALFAIFVVVIAGCASQATKNPNVADLTPNFDRFAKCLTEQGVTLYGTPTCPYCIKQRDMFGGSLQYLTYVDCTQEHERCGNLRGVPAWEFKDGSIIEGMQNFDALAMRTDCTLSQ